MIVGRNLATKLRGQVRSQVQLGNEGNTCFSVSFSSALRSPLREIHLEWVTTAGSPDVDPPEVG